MKLFDTSLPQNYSKGLFEEKNYDLSDTHTDKMFDVLFTATAGLLNDIKTKQRPVAFTFNKIDNSFVAGAVCQFFENEDSSKPGNWSLVWTFDENDIPQNGADTGLVLNLKDPQTHSYFRGIAGEKYGMRYKDPACLVTCLTYLLEQLYKWLDENAAENKEVSVEQDGIFQARVAVEGGAKVFAIEPAGEIKMLIKDDAAIEK